MRILIVSQWFQPEPHFKGLAFAKALQNRGHEVEVLTGFPNYPGGKLYDGYRLRAIQTEVMDGISVKRGYLFPSHDHSALRRIANYMSFAMSTTLIAFALKKPDVVYVYTPPMTAALAPVALRLFRRVPYLCDIQDLWPDTLAATGMINNRRLLGWIGRWTDFVLRRADRVVVLSDGFAERLRARGIAPARLAVVPNWAPPEIVEIARSLPMPASCGAGAFTILFAGNMGKAQGLETVIRAASLLQERRADIHFALIGGGVEVDRLKSAAAAAGLRNLDFHAPRHPSMMGEMFANADALLVHLRDDPLFEITIPSKTQAYLAIGRPILLGVRGDAARMVEQAGAGVSFAPEDALALADAAMRLAALPADTLAQMGEAGRRFYHERLSFEAGVTAIETQLRAAAGSP
ncbi:MAG: glycosyltransferase WbuB [Oxalobacteraceae bacterium]|nr:MAG: glycosyltransferase WbuB [Oxalobacteraceae bacterium]